MTTATISAGKTKLCYFWLRTGHNRLQHQRNSRLSNSVNGQVFFKGMIIMKMKKKKIGWGYLKIFFQEPMGQNSLDLH
jgi:hypothetical protein